MLIPLDNIKQVYQHLIEKAIESDSEGTSIYLLVSNDTDSLCAAKLLTSLLKKDHVLHTCVPVFSNSHLLSELAKLESLSCLRSLVFINCGGSINLTTQKFYTRQESNVTAYLFDSHRPFHHCNINDEK